MRLCRCAWTVAGDGCGDEPEQGLRAAKEVQVITGHVPVLYS